jgi:hypothetical protein
MLPCNAVAIGYSRSVRSFDSLGGNDTVNANRSPLPMFLAASGCIVVAALLIYSMPQGPPPTQPDGSILMSTIYEYDRSAWKVYPIFGLGFAALICLSLGCWRWIRRKKEAHETAT